MSERLRVGVLASGRGSNLRALVAATRAGDVPAEVAVVVSDRADAGAIAFAREQGIAAVLLDPRHHPTPTRRR
jgi:phosphoribosylglycinamide formyltransferase-1